MSTSKSKTSWQNGAFDTSEYVIQALSFAVWPSDQTIEPQGMQEIIDTGLKKADIGHVEGILSEMIFLPKSISK